MPAEVLGGNAFLKIDGKQFTLAGTLTYSLDSFEREGKSGLSGPAGYIETGIFPFVEAEIFMTSKVSLEELRSMKDVTVMLQRANAKSYVWRNSWTTKAHEVNEAEGTVSVRFEGLSAEEVT